MLSIHPIADHEVDRFSSIWIPWLEGMGRTVEPEDREIMRDPAAYYRTVGGEAFLATLHGETVGAVAIKSLGSSGFEFCKLVVSERARGLGAGRALVQQCLDFSSQHGGPDLYLQSFNALDVALGLYRRMGFVDCDAPKGMFVLDRTEVIMVKRT